MSDTYPAPGAPYGWPELRQLWARIQERRATEWAPGKALEYLVLRAFQLDGAGVRAAFDVRVKDAPFEELDGAVYAAGLHCLVECKDRRQPLGTEAIAKMHSQLLRRPAGTVGLMFSPGGYQPSAKTLAQFAAHHPVLLWYRDEITHVLERENPCEMLHRKYRLCVEEGAPHQDTTAGRL